jgi:hypothetical protein
MIDQSLLSREKEDGDYNHVGFTVLVNKITLHKTFSVWING